MLADNSLKDGTYIYRRATAFAGEDITATVRGGVVTDWQRNGLSVTFWGMNPADFTAELRQEISSRALLGRLVHQVELVAATGEVAA